MALLKVETVENAIKKCQNHLEQYHLSKTEIISIENALGRIASRDIKSHEVLPNFTRSTVDGYALKSKDTLGASESIPSLLKCVEVIKMGETAQSILQAGECAYVPTGGMLPEGADSVVMIEHTEIFNQNDVLIYRAVSNNENVLREGEDIELGQTLLNSGDCFSAQMIGLCAGVGISEVEVYARLNVAIISTGDEVYPINHSINKGQVHDINGILLNVMLKKLNMNVQKTYIIQDNYNELHHVISDLSQTMDIIFVSGGSSQGEKDYTVKLFESLGESSVWSHGLSVKPGKPTILGSYQSCLLIGLPGHPVSAFAIFNRVFKTALLNAYKQSLNKLNAVLDSNVIASQGKETIIYCHVYQNKNELYARIVYTKSGLISTLKEANAYLIVPGHLEGYKKGECVEVIIL